MAAPFDITLAEAAQKTLQFQTIYNPNTKALCFPRNEILELLSQPNCNGIRIYFGLSDPSKPKDLTVILVGVREETSAGTTAYVDITGAGTKLKNSGMPCPPECTVPANELSH
jgi:hypothetical protein